MTQVRPSLNILLIARHYPPAVSGGARRPYHLARALAECGANITVAAPDPDPELDSIVTEHPRRDPVVETEPGRHHKSGWRDRVRPWVYWPDPDIVWTRRVVQSVLARSIKPDWVITTSPPESIHWAGFALKQRLGCGWAADFRDHWFKRAFQTYRRGRSLRGSLERLYAKRLLGSVDHLSAVNPAILAEIEALAGARADRTALVLGHFAVERQAEPFRFEGRGPHLVHTGSFELSDPDTLIETLIEPFEIASAADPNLRLHLVGRLTRRERSVIENSPASGAIILHGVVDMTTALAMQDGSDALVLVASRDAGVPPGKVSEYLGAARPVIAIGSEDWIEACGFVSGDPAHLMASPQKLYPLPPTRRPPDALTSAQALLDSLARTRR